MNDYSQSASINRIITVCHSVGLDDADLRNLVVGICSKYFSDRNYSLAQILAWNGTTAPVIANIVSGIQSDSIDSVKPLPGNGALDLPPNIGRILSIAFVWQTAKYVGLLSPLNTDLEKYVFTVDGIPNGIGGFKPPFATGDTVTFSLQQGTWAPFAVITPLVKMVRIPAFVTPKEQLVPAQWIPEGTPLPQRVLDAVARGKW